MRQVLTVLACLAIVVVLAGCSSLPLTVGTPTTLPPAASVTFTTPTNTLGAIVPVHIDLGLPAFDDLPATQVIRAQGWGGDGWLVIGAVPGSVVTNTPAVTNAPGM
jgi:hypothetical protein